MDIPCVGAIIQDDDGRIIVVRRSGPPGQGLWSIPGGRVEPRESPQAAVQREVLEETGLQVDVGEVAGEVVRAAPSPSDRYLITDFFARVTPGTTTHPVPDDDADDVRWVDGAEFLELELTPELAETLQGWNTWA
jgi:ADP-ribose pyrophosphatase YjhB (NUDIX family)